MACTKVFVGSLPPGTKPKELRHLFQNFGIVVECDVMNRCGFVHMESPAMAQSAINALNGSEFKGQMIVVEPGRAKEKKPQSGAIGNPAKSGNMIMPNMPQAGEHHPNPNRNFNTRGRGGGGGNMQGNNQRGGGVMGRGGGGRGGGGQRGAPSFRGGFGRGHNPPNINDSFGPIRNISNFKPNRSAPYPRGNPSHMRGGGNFNGGGGRNPGFQRFGGGGQPMFENSREQNFHKPSFGSNFDDDTFPEEFNTNSYSRNSNHAPMKPNMNFSHNGGQDRRGFTLSSVAGGPPVRPHQNSYHQQSPHQSFPVPQNIQRGNFHQSRGSRGQGQRGGNHPMHNTARPGPVPTKRPMFNNDGRPNKMPNKNFSANSSNFNAEFPPLNGGGMMGPSHRGGFKNRIANNVNSGPPFRGNMRGNRRFP